MAYTLLLDRERRVLIGEPVNAAEIGRVGGVVCFAKRRCAMQDGTCHGWTLDVAAGDGPD